MKWILYALLMCAAGHALNHDEVANDLRRIEQGETDRVHNLLYPMRRGFLTQVLVDRAVIVCRRVLETHKSERDAHDAAFFLDLAGMESEEVQRQIEAGLKANFPLVRNGIRGVRAEDVSIIAQIKNPNEGTLEFILDLAQHAGNKEGATQSLNTLIV